MFLTKNSKSPYFQVVYFVNGKRTTISTKTANQEKAELFLKNFNPSITIKQSELVQQTKVKSNFISISDFKNEYLAFAHTTKSQSYLRSISLSFKMFAEYLGNIPIQSITSLQIDKFVTFTFGRTKRGAHLYFRTLKAAFTKAVAWNYIKENPFKNIKFPRIPKSHPVFISVEEFKIILSQTNEEILKQLFIAAFNTGMRLGELTNMKWSWIDFQKSLISIKCSADFSTKSKKERIIPINAALRATLMQLKQSKHYKPEGYVFTNSIGIKLNDDFVSKKFKKSVRLTGLKDSIHFHTLRHSFASMLVQKGVSLYVVKELLGHEDLSTTQIYSHLNNENLIEAVNLI